MRQVMPHRNNIGARPSRCKSFLRPVGDCPVNWRGCGISIRPAHNGVTVNNVFLSMV